MISELHVFLVARYVWTVMDSVWADYEPTGGSRSPRFGIPRGEPDETLPGGKNTEAPAVALR